MRREDQAVMAADQHIGASNRRRAVGLPAADTAADAAATRQPLLLTAVFVAVIGVDQVVKWWAWRHIDGSLINRGGFILLGPNIRSWFATPASGAAADVVGGVLVMVAVRRLLRGRRPVPMLLGGGMIAAGFLSNILDRIGLHNWTAPGSARGVVDFIPDIGPGRYNVADLWIGVGTVLLGCAFARRRPTSTRARQGEVKPGAMRSRGADRTYAYLALAIVFLALLTLAVVSAVDYGGLESPPIN
jgi:lipoprotein signal peptidase